MCASADFKEKIAIYLPGFFWGGGVYLCGFHPPPYPLFVCKKGLDAAIVLGADLIIWKSLSGAVVSLAVLFVPATCQCGYTGNKFLKRLPPSLSLTSNKIE